MVIVMMIISHIEPPLYTSLTRVFIGLSMLLTCTKPWAWTHGFWAHGFSCGMHKTMGLEHGFVHTVLYGCFPMPFEYEKKYITFKVLGSSPNGKINVFYLGGARFKSCLHPSICTRMPLGPRIIFIFIIVCVMCVELHYFTISPIGHTTSRHPPPPNRTSFGMCQEEKSDVVDSKVVGL